MKSVKELIALAKAKPGSLNYGMTGVGNPLHLTMEMFKTEAGVDIQAVPYRGDAAIFPALITGEVQVAVVPLATSLAACRRPGSVRALAVGGAKRSAALPDVPTVAESGLAGFESTSWQGWFVPANTPREIVGVIQRGGEQGVDRARSARASARHRQRAGGQHARGVRREVQGRSGEVCQDREGSQGSDAGLTFGGRRWCRWLERALPLPREQPGGRGPQSRCSVTIEWPKVGRYRELRAERGSARGGTLPQTLRAWMSADLGPARHRVVTATLGEDDLPRKRLSDSHILKPRVAPYLMRWKSSRPRRITWDRAFRSSRSIRRGGRSPRRRRRVNLWDADFLESRPAFEPSRYGLEKVGLPARRRRPGSGLVPSRAFTSCITVMAAIVAAATKLIIACGSPISASSIQSLRS